MGARELRCFMHLYNHLLCGDIEKLIGFHLFFILVYIHSTQYFYILSEIVVDLPNIDLHSHNVILHYKLKHFANTPQTPGTQCFRTQAENVYTEGL